MTIRKKIYTAGAVVFVLLVILAWMNIAMHLRVRHNLAVRDHLSQRLAATQAHEKWANNLNLLVSDIVAADRVPDFVGTALAPPAEIDGQESHVLLEHAQALIDLVQEKTRKVEESQRRFEALRVTINSLYYELEEKIATVLAEAQMDRIMGEVREEESSLAPYVLKSLNQLTLVAMDSLLRREHPESAVDIVSKNRRFLAAQLHMIDKDGSMASLFDSLLTNIDAMSHVFPEVAQSIGTLENHIRISKAEFDETLGAYGIHAAVTEAAEEVLAANEGLESASRNTLMVCVLFLIGAPLLVISTGLVGLNKLIVRPITNLVTAMKDVEHGAFDVEAAVETPDEVGTLAQAFNAMARQIKAKVDDLAMLNQSLEESEEQLKAVLESNANPIMVRDAQGRPKYVNPAFTEVFGWELADMKDEQTPYVPDDQIELTKSRLSEAHTTGRPVKFRSERLTKQGTPLDVIIGVALLKGGGLKGGGMVENLTDVSEQTRLEAQLRQSHKMEAIGQFGRGCGP